MKLDSLEAGRLHPQAEVKRLAGLTGAMSLLIALPYLLPVMSVEEEVSYWGVVSLGLGLLLPITARFQAIQALVRLETLAVVLLQVLPIGLWLMLGITTDDPWIQHGPSLRLCFAAAHAGVLMVAARALRAISLLQSRTA
mgnify:CR=1 FL=1